MLHICAARLLGCKGEAMRSCCNHNVQGTQRNSTNAHHMECVAILFVALYLASAVPDPNKGAWILQQAHDVCFG